MQVGRPSPIASRPSPRLAGPGAEVSVRFMNASSARSLPAMRSDHGEWNFVRACVDRGAFAGTATSPPHMIGREQEEHEKNDHE